MVTGLRTDRREYLVTSAHDAVPESRHELPEESIWPLVMAAGVGVTFIGAVFRFWMYGVGFAWCVVAFAGWGWPRGTNPEDVVYSRKRRRVPNAPNAPNAPNGYGAPAPAAAAADPSLRSGREATA